MNIDMNKVKQDIENELNNRNYSKAMKSQSIVEYIGSHIQDMLEYELGDLKVKIDPATKSINSTISLKNGFELETEMKFSTEVFSRIGMKFKF